MFCCYQFLFHLGTNIFSQDGVRYLALSSSTPMQFPSPGPTPILYICNIKWVRSPPQTQLPKYFTIPVYGTLVGVEDGLGAMHSTHCTWEYTPYSKSWTLKLTFTWFAVSWFVCYVSSSSSRNKFRKCLKLATDPEVPGSIPGPTRFSQKIWIVGGLEWGPFSLVRTTEELLERKSSGSGLEKPKN
jgi:hypothetical protein